MAFSGKLSVSAEDGSLIQRARHQQEKRQREAVLREMEEYEEAMQEQASRRKISVRDEGHLLPTILPETARPLLGPVPKGKPVPLSEATLEAGNILVWGADLLHRLQGDQGQVQEDLPHRHHRLHRLHHFEDHAGLPRL